MGDLISVVVPIYNVEKYLDRCIESIIDQTYQNLEIILVDDGSPDKCPEMCDEWAKRDSRIKVIHKKNAGLGMARNTGIENAAGEYICFFDSDDYVAPNIIENAHALAEKEKADIVTFGRARVVNGEVKKEYIPESRKYVYRDEEIQNLFVPDLIGSTHSPIICCSNVSLSACFNLFNIKLIERADWKFVSERELISEDVYSMLQLYRYVKCVAILPEVGYFYCYNETSLSQTYKVERYSKIKYFYANVKDLCERLNYNSAVFQRIDRMFLSFTTTALKHLSNSNETLTTKFTMLRKIVFDHSLQEVLARTSMEGYNIKLRLFFFSLRAKLIMIVFVMAKAQAKIKS